MKTVIQMAREAELYLDGENLQQPLWVLSDKELERFAALVRADEREACAKVCDACRDEWLKGLGRYEFMGEGADYLADFIRARSST